MHKYDVVIIGAGLGGLACGSILSQHGYKVCILEQHYQIGGCLQSFKRKGIFLIQACIISEAMVKVKY
ncbi:MAG: NAD(P)-binding protein [Chloroflexia bacterium]|nr:NAD(P)-binding protein [Chloroflexia bacterium]